MKEREEQGVRENILYGQLLIIQYMFLKSISKSIGLVHIIIIVTMVSFYEFQSLKYYKALIILMGK